MNPKAQTSGSAWSPTSTATEKNRSTPLCALSARQNELNTSLCSARAQHQLCALVHTSSCLVPVHQHTLCALCGRLEPKRFWHATPALCSERQTERAQHQRVYPIQIQPPDSYTFPRQLYISPDSGLQFKPKRGSATTNARSVRPVSSVNSDSASGSQASINDIQNECNDTHEALEQCALEYYNLEN